MGLTGWWSLDLKVITPWVLEQAYPALIIVISGSAMLQADSPAHLPTPGLAQGEVEGRDQLEGGRTETPLWNEHFGAMKKLLQNFFLTHFLFSWDSNYIWLLAIISQL